MDRQCASHRVTETLQARVSQFSYLHRASDGKHTVDACLQVYRLFYFERNQGQWKIIDEGK
jgi:hypothetical protein